MLPGAAKQKEIIRQLQRDVLQYQRLDKISGGPVFDSGLGPLEQAFPSGSFPVGAVHEFLSEGLAHAAATSAFISAILGRLMQEDGYCLWVGNRRSLFPHGLQAFGVVADRIIFIDVAREKEALWVMEEALKCSSLAAVVGELSNLSFKESRRLQLAVEQSRVTGFIHRYDPRSEQAVACVSRWKIRSLPGIVQDNMPGLANPRWEVQLLRIRNGYPGSWQLEWTADGFRQVHAQAITTLTPVRKIG